MNDPGPGLDLLDRAAQALRGVSRPHFIQALDVLAAARRERRRVYTLGNGGSSATAAHLACDLAKGAGCCPSARLRAHCLTDGVPTLTAWANDAGYGRALAAQLDVLLEPGDVVVAISVSGRSPNVLAALRRASRAGATTLALVGSDGGEALGLADVALHVPEQDYGAVETAHLGIAHALTAALRAAPCCADAAWTAGSASARAAPA